MAEPLLNTDVHGLSSQARVWTPKGMLKDQDARDLLESLADALADALNPLIDMELYLPIILNPTRNLDNDVIKVLDLNGIETRLDVVAKDKLRRLAILGPELRSFRGAFRSHRSVATALTRGPAIIRTWITYRIVLDESTLDAILLFDGFEDETHFFVLGQGPSASDYIQPEISDKIENLAAPVLDTSEITPTWALTAWRNGIGTWKESGEPVIVDGPANSTEIGEFEAVDMGPAVDASPIQRLLAPTDAPPDAVPATTWGTVFFKTDSHTVGDFWNFHMLLETATEDSYGLRIRPGNQTVTIHRFVAGVPGAAKGTVPAELGSSLAGDYHRIDFIVHKKAGLTLLRVIIDGTPSGWFEDLIVAGRPTGLRGGVSLKTAAFTTGRLRVGAVTFRRNE